MSKCCNCLLNFAKKCFVSQMSWTAALIVSTALTSFTAFISIYGLTKVWKLIFIISLISTIISYMILIFSFFASRCGNSQHKLSLGIILIVYGILILIFAITFGSIRKLLVTKIENSFNGTDYSTNDQQKIENSFECCGTIFCQAHHPERENCHGKIENLIQKITKGGIASSIVLAILVWIAAIFCLIDSKVFLKNEKDGSLLKSDLEQPILENTN